MSDTTTFEVTQFVPAPTGRVFAILTDPRQHVVIDGSGMLNAAESGPITEVGQSFVMNMHHPDLGRYRTVNTVTELEPGVSVGWAPALDRSYECELVDMLAGITTGGHTYTYRLREVDGGTEVTETYDWSGVGDPKFAAFCPFVSRDQLAGTLANLARAVEAR